MRGAGVDLDLDQFTFGNIRRRSKLSLANGKVATQEILRDQPDYFIEIARGRLVQQGFFAAFQAHLVLLDDFSGRDICYGHHASPIGENANACPYWKISFGIAHESTP